jgi:hypothetical protein
MMHRPNFTPTEILAGLLSARNSVPKTPGRTAEVVQVNDDVRKGWVDVRYDGKLTVAAGAATIAQFINHWDLG